MTKTLTYLSKALPITGRALYLRTSFNKSLINSFTYLLEICVEVIPADLFESATHKLNSLNSESKLSGLLSILHTDLFNSANENNIQGVNESVKSLTKINFQVKEIIYIGLSSLSEYFMPLVKHTFSQEILVTPIFFPLSSEDFERIKASFQRGFAILKRSFLDFFEHFPKDI